MYSALHNHDYYSLLDGYGSPREMLDRAKEIGLKAYAITNHGNAYAFIYYDLIKKEYPDIKMIYGCELYECEDITIKNKDSRDAIIKYLVDKYGEDRVCQIINYSYITPTVAITDVGKILGFPYNQMQKLSQKFTSDKWDECMKTNPKLIIDNPQYAELFDIAKHLSGRVKTVSIHAGGIGIVDTSVNDYMPMKIGTNGEHVIQADKHYIEDIGIVKFDLLGVATLNLVKEIKDDLHLNPWDYDINNPAFENDRQTYELLASGKTNGVFQVESAGMKDLLIRLISIGIM